MDTSDAALLGHFHFPLDRAALCAESTCNRVFDISTVRGSDGVARCPACGGEHWIMLGESLGARAIYRDIIEQAIDLLSSAP